MLAGTASGHTASTGTARALHGQTAGTGAGRAHGQPHEAGEGTGQARDTGDTRALTRGRRGHGVYSKATLRVKHGSGELAEKKF